MIGCPRQTLSRGSSGSVQRGILPSTGDRTATHSKPLGVISHAVAAGHSGFYFFQIARVPLSGPKRFEWGRPRTALDPASLLAEPLNEIERSEANLAQDWLTDDLADQGGEATSKDLRAAGLEWNTVRKTPRQTRQADAFGLRAESTLRLATALNPGWSFSAQHCWLIWWTWLTGSPKEGLPDQPGQPEVHPRGWRRALVGWVT